jgi:hypothetical protein
MKKFIVACAIAGMTFNSHAHGSFGRTVGAVVVGAVVAGALMPRVVHPHPYGYNGYPQVSPYTGQVVHCPSCAPAAPQNYMDQSGTVYNLFGHPVCLGIPVYDPYGNIIGYQRGC